MRNAIKTGWAGMAALFLVLSQGAVQADEVDDLSALARLYGDVRYFHPSDEAASMDWNGFATHAVQQVLHRGREPMDEVLSRLFQPVAPTLVLYRKKNSAPAIELGDGEGLSLIAWQHQGVSLDMEHSPYRSERTGRPPSSGPGFAPFGQILPAIGMAGQSVKLEARVWAQPDGDNASARLWLRADGAQGMLMLDNMEEAPIIEPEWRRYGITMTVPEGTTYLNLGGLLIGGGEARFDDISIAVESDGKWQPLKLANPGFESGSHRGWQASSQTYQFAIRHDRGGHVLVVSPNETSRLFEALPEPGETIDRTLARRLHMRLPLTLWGSKDQTQGSTEASRAAYAALAQAVAETPSEESIIAAAGVMATWATLKHFYPYWDVVAVDWEAQLEASLKDALEAETRSQTQAILERLVAALDDGHGRVVDTQAETAWFAPFTAEWVEGRLVVVAPYHGVRRGDVITGYEGRSMEAIWNEARSHMSGSEQWKRHRFARRFGRGPASTSFLLQLERNGQGFHRTIKRVTWEQKRVPEAGSEPVRALSDRVMYVNLDRATMAVIDQYLAEIVQAPAVIFDLRGYPNGNHRILQHLLDQPDESDAWMQIPQIIRPDQADPPNYQNNGWSLTPLEPRIQGQVAFVTDGRAISYAESVMGFVEHYRLGEILGSPTAGANGNVNRLDLPGGFQVLFTGMRVVKHDGSQLHTIGIQPTVPAQRTLAGVIDGRDEVLEAAIQAVGGLGIPDEEG